MMMIIDGDWGLSTKREAQRGAEVKVEGIARRLYNGCTRWLRPNGRLIMRVRVRLRMRMRMRMRYRFD